MKVSVALASYNGARFIEEQLRSLAAQTLLPDELIVTDDGSEDQTVDIVLDFARTAPFDVKIFRNPKQLGYGHNFGNALARCKGEIIFLCDQDDFWFPQKIKTIIDLSRAMPDKQLFMNNSIITDIFLQPTVFTKLDQAVASGHLRDSFAQGCCMAIRRQLLEVCQPMPIRVLLHDVWISHISEAFSAKHVIDEPLQYYRRHDKNASQSLSSSLKKISWIDIVSKRVEFYWAAIKILSKTPQEDNQLFLLQDAVRIRLAHNLTALSSLETDKLFMTLKQLRQTSRSRRLRRYARSLPFLK